MLSLLSKPMESRVPVNWHARFGEQHGGNIGHAMRPHADSTHTKRFDNVNLPL
jgi:hypothetical protein